MGIVSNNKTPSILILEEEKDLGETLKDFLEKNGYHVQYVNGRVSEITKINDHSVHLLISDYNVLKNLSDAICGNILAVLVNQPKVILITGDILFDSEAGILELDVNDIIEKPFSKNQLLKSIERVLWGRGEERKQDESNVRRLKDNLSDQSKLLIVNDKAITDEEERERVQLSNYFINQAVLNTPLKGYIEKSLGGHQ